MASSDNLKRALFGASPARRLSHKLRSITSADDYKQLCSNRSANGGRSPDAALLRESRSLDPFPVTIEPKRKRLDALAKRVPRLAKTIAAPSRTGSQTFAAPTVVSTISHESIADGSSAVRRQQHDDPQQQQPRQLTALTTKAPNNSHNSDQQSYHKYLHNNNCNGSIGNGAGQEEQAATCPLLTRQTSLTTPQDHHDCPGLYTNNSSSKRWYSLEHVGVPDEDACSKKSLTRSSIKSWLVGFIHGNGFKSSDSSLRKVGVLPVGVGGVTGFGELQPTPEKESMV